MPPSQREVKLAAQIAGVALLLTLLAIEVALEIETTPSNSFSHILRAWSVVGIAAPFGWGTLAGHFFHPVDELESVFRRARLTDTQILIVAVTPILALIAIDVIVAKAADHWIYPKWTSPFMLYLGAAWGALFWPVTMRGEGAAG
jgi:hypothetical protein